MLTLNNHFFVLFLENIEREKYNTFSEELLQEETYVNKLIMPLSTICAISQELRRKTSKTLIWSFKYKYYFYGTLNGKH